MRWNISALRNNKLINNKTTISSMNATFLTLIMAVSTIINSPAERPISETAYTFLKKDKNITLASRELTLPDNRKTRELRAEFVVDADVATILKVIRNEKYATIWMKGVKEFTTIRRENENDWFAYVQYDVPWPLSNQDCIIRYQCVAAENGKGYVLNLNGSPDYLPVKPGVERISHLCGRWTITGGVSGSRVVYTVYSEQKPKYPRWATDPIIQQNLINTLASMKELSENIR
jgi:hypothetical protein